MTAFADTLTGARVSLFNWAAVASHLYLRLYGRHPPLCKLG